MWLAALLAGVLSQASAPVIVPDGPVMNLEEVGLYATRVWVSGEGGGVLSAGAVSGLGRGDGGGVFAAGDRQGEGGGAAPLPMEGRDGVAFQEFRFALPRVKGITLKGATAMRADALLPEHSDGVTFRVKVDGKTLYDNHRQDGDWDEFTIDLTAFSGREVTVRFEVDPGPKDNSAFDYAEWGGRELLLDGFVAAQGVTRVPPAAEFEGGAWVRAGAWCRCRDSRGR